MEPKDFRLRFIEWVCWAFFALCVVVIGRWVILAFVRWAGWGIPDWAAWVQAVGSIAAIMGTFALARQQLKNDRKRRVIETIESNLGYANAAVRLAADCFHCLDDTAGKMSAMGKTRRRAIGTERLEQLLQALHSFAAKPIPPGILSETLVLQREIAFTLTAVRELGTRPASEQRLENAEKRTNACLNCRTRLQQLESRVQRKLESADNFL